jgi:hypothetical protein
MRNYSPMRLPPMSDRVLRNELRRTNDWLRQLGPHIGRTVIVKQGTPAAVTQSVDLAQFLYLPGRAPIQVSKGNVQFDADGGFVAQPLDTIVGLSMKSMQAAGNTTTVYFNLGDSGQDYIGRWTFPVTSSSPSDNIFVAESASQTLTNKTLQQGTIWVGTNSAANTFRSTSNGGLFPQDFKISPNTGFPNNNTLTPTLRLPSLDTTTPLTDIHTFMLVASSATAPFTVGSIAHGNVNGTEMEMLSAGVNGTVLQYNSGETISGSWTNGTFTITGAFTAANTKVGMRVRGASAPSVYIERDTKITAITPGVSITVDIALVGNGVGVTVTTYGPTWGSRNDFSDAVFRIYDDGDPTKLLAFQLSGLTTGTTRTWTVPDVSGTVILSLGTSAGQNIGSGSAPTGGNTNSLSILGQVIVDPNNILASFTANRAFQVQSTPSVVNGTGALMHSTFSASVAGQSGTTMAENYAVRIVLDGTFPATAGSNQHRTLDVTGAPNIPSGVTCSELFGMLGSVQGVVSGAPLGTITNLTGVYFEAIGSTNGSAAHTNIRAFRCRANPRGAAVTNVTHIGMELGTGTWTGAVSLWTHLNIGTVGNDALVTTWRGLSIGSVTSPSNSWALDIANTYSRHQGKIAIGNFPANNTDVTAYLHLAAGTASAGTAPLKLTSGTLLTTAEAGAIEFNTNDFYATITTGPTRQIILRKSNATPFSTFNIPIAQAGGAFTGSANFTFNNGTNVFTTIGTIQATGGSAVLTSQGTLNVTGVVNFGTQAKDTVSKVQSDYTDTSTGTVNIAGIGGLLRVGNIASSNANFLGFDGGVRVMGSTLTQAGVGLGAVGLRGLAIINTNVTIPSVTALNGLVYTEGSGPTITDAYAVASRWTLASGTVTNGYGLYSQNPDTSGGGAITNFYALYLENPTAGGTINRAIYSAGGSSILAGKVRIGDTTAPSHILELAAGSTTVAPLKLTSGTSLTTAVAGVVEFTTDDFFATITTGAARKAFVLDDGARLTSGKIPIATTNGRLVDLTASSAYTPSNVTTDRSYDANATTLDELADIVGTMIADLQAKGILG